jgi:hypothetical protein
LLDFLGQFGRLILLESIFTDRFSECIIERKPI